MPNGIEVSADGRLVFVNSDGEVRRIVRETGEVETTAQLGGLDNARWAPDGRLVVASVAGGAPEELAFCMALESGACPMEFRILAIDPVSLETEELYHNQGPPHGRWHRGARNRPGNSSSVPSRVTAFSAWRSITGGNP